MIDKLIVTNRAALRAKYGATGFSRVGDALRSLVEADRKRGLVSKVAFLDVDVDDHRGTKRAIDALFRTESPDYVMIVGAPDVVCHQPLDNPLFDPPDDPDRYAWSDLPYASDSPHSRDVADFSGPTRVVGRLPDLVGATQPGQAAHLIRLIDAAMRYRRLAPDAYARYFALSARSWHRSTERNLFAIFGHDDHLNTSPPHGPRFRDALRARAHLINCHGDEGSDEFLGQYYQRYPTALSTKAIDRRIAKGTVVAAECCYGAQLYNAGLIGTDIPICQSYLRQGAYGFFGSTTIAYGDSRALDAADLIVQFFWLAVLDGASLGRAALLARQRYVRENADLSPMDLKTLAQFVLLGDPSLHPIEMPEATRDVDGVDAPENRRVRRKERRAKLAVDGRHLRETRPTASRGRPLRDVPHPVQRTLETIAKETGIASPERFRVFSVKRRGKTIIDAAIVPSHYFVAVRKPSNAGPGPHAIAVVAKQVNGRIVDVRTLEQR